MKVVLDKNSEYDIIFRRNYIEQRKHHLVDTECFISRINDNKTGEEKYNPISSGLAHQSPRDIFNKAIGRKIALGRALQKTDFSKEDRTIFWKIYFDHCKII